MLELLAEKLPVVVFTNPELEITELSVGESPPGVDSHPVCVVKVLLRTSLYLQDQAYEEV